MELNEQNGIGQIDINYYAEGNISLILMSDEVPTFALSLPSEVMDGRTLAGGTRFTFL
ncbi:MAG: hypothetical protein ACK5MR_17725 [Cumulibacter sp.]